MQHVDPMGQHSLFHAAASPAQEDGDKKEIIPKKDITHHIHSQRHLRRQKSAGTTTPAVTEVTQTISVIEQIDVNTSGAVLSTEDVPLQSSSLPAATDASTAIVATTSIEPTGTLSSSSAILSSPVSTVALSTTGSIDVTTTESQSVSDLTSTPFPTTTFATITAGSNSITSPLTSSGSLSSTVTFSTTNSNSTSTSSSSSLSSSSLILTSSSFSSGLISTTFTSGASLSTFSASSFTSTSQSSDISSSTSSSAFDSASQSTAGSSGGVTGAGPTGTSASTTATPTSSAGGLTNALNGATSAPTTTVLASVFGGIAGIGVILVFFLILIKWHKRRTSNQALGGSSDEGARDLANPVNPQSSPPAVSERPRFAMPAGLLNLTAFRPNRASRQTMRTVSSTAGSEQGFVRVSGRKIRSVLESGGDGYGDPSNADGASYQDPHSYGGPGTPTTAMGGRGSGIPNLRPSPARTPVVENGAFPELNFDQQPPSRLDGSDLPRPSPRTSMDGSRAGSHGSAPRFTEDV